MLVIKARNVNEALPLGIMYLNAHGKEISPRGQRTLEYPTPVCTEYSRPWENVVLEPRRDFNATFALMEALWILGGRNDVNFPCMFNSQLAKYSDDGKTFHGSYGHRIRSCGKDQLKEVISKLKKDPDTRQAVLQIWDYKKDLNIQSNDIPCNDIVFCKIRDGKLNISVGNRSNDIILGAYNVNTVQFSFIQEYIASMVGCDMGVYRQVSDSYHAYIDHPMWEKLQGIAPNDIYPYKHYSLISNTKTFDKELSLFLDGNWPMFWDNSFFPEVAIPVFEAWFAHKDCKNGAPIIREQCKASDWGVACANWLKRRGDV